jgi:septum site-determining protein MinC
MTVAFEEKAVLEFKGRMLMMTVLLLKDLDPNTLHRQVSQRLEDAAQWLRDAPVVVDLAQPEGADQVALMAAVDTLRGLGVNLVALARNEHLDSDTAAMLGLGSISLAGGRDVPRGRALAGVRGDQSARIFCQKLDAELVSIAGIYRVAEDLPEQHRKQAVHITLDGDAMRFADLK